MHLAPKSTSVRKRYYNPPATKLVPCSVCPAQLASYNELTIHMNRKHRDYLEKFFPTTDVASTEKIQCEADNTDRRNAGQRCGNWAVFHGLCNQHVEQEKRQQKEGREGARVQA